MPWDGATAAYPITVKELLPILIAAATWGRIWSGHRVLCLCNNQAVIACLKSRARGHKALMHLLRNLINIEAHFSFYLCPQYIDTHATTWHMTCHVTTCFLSFQRSLMPHGHQPQYLRAWWSFSWTLRPIGPRYNGASSSELFSPGTSPLNPKDV